jgi:beta-glucosidase
VKIVVSVPEVEVAVAVRVGGAAVVVRGIVRNTGDRDGTDVVQVYAELPGPDAPARLVHFARVDVTAGSASPFEVAVGLDRLATRDPERRAWQPATGCHRIIIGRFAGDPASVTAELDL